VEQAKDMSGIVSVESLIVLECESKEVYKRIEQNIGRDRTGRIDDSLDMVRRKLEIFKARSVPLINYYANRAVISLRHKSQHLDTGEHLRCIYCCMQCLTVLYFLVMCLCLSIDCLCDPISSFSRKRDSVCLNGSGLRPAPDLIQGKPEDDKA